MAVYLKFICKQCGTKFQKLSTMPGEPEPVCCENCTRSNKQIMGRWFVSGEIREKGSEKPFLPHWESVNAVSAEHAITNYIACVALLKPEREIKKIYPPQELGPASEE